MKRTLKTVFSLLLVMAMVLSFSATAQAAGATVTFNGKAGYAIASGSGYTDTDLFDHFKNVMPGDKLSQEITIRNAANGCDYIKVYLKALPHDEDDNPLTYSETYENTDGNDQQNVAGERDETVASMQEFLQQLTMTVKNGETVIFQGTPDVAGSLANNVLLGQLSKGESMKLTVELEVPIDLGNEYAHRVGEVDWVFLAEAYQYRQLTVQKVWDDNGDPSRPASVTVNLMRNGVKVDSVELTEKMQWTHTWDLLDDLNEDYEGYTWTVEEEVPEGYRVSYKAEGNTFFITSLIFFSSFISPTLLCSRPAVSMSTTSAPFALALLNVSNATDAGSLPICCLMTVTPTLSPQIHNCSTAAARNVSAAPRYTFFPACLN